MRRGLAMMGAALLLGGAAPDLATDRLRLMQARRDFAVASARAAALERHALSERSAAAKARAQAAAISARIAAAQDDIAAAEARVRLADASAAAQRARLAAGEAPAARLLGALQALAMRPVAAALVQPGSVDDLAHVRAVLGATLPVMRARTATVRAELAETRRSRREALFARQSLAESRAQLTARRAQLAALEATHRSRSTVLTRTALAESDRAIAMGERAREIVDRMGTAGTEADAQAALAALPGPVSRPGSADSADRGPSNARGAYRLPVVGRLVAGLGELSSAGVRARGLTLAVSPGAAVIAPAAGRIAYAAPFRGYGQVVIIDHGTGWTSLISGLGTIGVRAGDWVAAGAALGQAPADDEARVTVELRRQGRPVDMIPLLG